MKKNTFLVAIITSLLLSSVSIRSQKKLYLISNSHMDTQWNWTVKKTIDEYIPNTFDGNFLLFEKYPAYVFNFEGAIKYKWLKEYYPDKFAKLKEYVAAGRWNISGFSVDADDVNVPSSESLIRNFLYGQSFYKTEFGTTGSRDIMLPDCFGFGYNLPSIAVHCGIIGFHSQKLSWGSAYGIPFTFGIWQGVDGNSIPAILRLGQYDEQGAFQKDLTNDAATITEINKNGQTLGVYASPRYYGKMGDIGGPPDDITVSWLQKNVDKKDGQVQVIAAKSDQFFKDLTTVQKAALPVWNNELLMTQHGTGCYTSQAAIKRWNRKNELLADAAEKSSVLANWLGGISYDSEKLKDAWFRVLWHQFHDDLTGTSIPQAYTFTWNDDIIAQNSFAEVLNNSAGAVIRSLDTRSTGIPIAVYNPLSITRTDIVELTVNMASQPAGIAVFDKDNVQVPAQITGYIDGKLSLIFAATVPSMGYAMFDVQPVTTAPVVNAALKISGNTIENTQYKVTLNANGDVSSIVDKTQANKELLMAPIRMQLLGDNSSGFPSWEIVYSDLTADPLGFVDEAVNVSVLETGPLRATLKISRKKDASTFVQYLQLYGYGNVARIDFKNEVEWQTQNRLLKAVFPIAEGNAKATYDISLGAIVRGNNTSSLYEVTGHQWADLSQASGTSGVSILNDCKYGWDKPDNNTLRLTLIHSPDASGYGYQRFQDMGHHDFTYSFLGHVNSWSQAGTPWQAAQLNQPLIAFQPSAHEGTLGKSISLAEVSTTQVGIKACKKAEDRDEIILRVHELTGQDASNVTITFPAQIVSASEVNGVEEVLSAARIDGNKLIFDIKRFQPKAFAIKLASVAAVSKLTLPVSTPVTLPYNIDVVSTDADKANGNFCGTGLSYPAELFPQTLNVDDVTFTLGDKTDNSKNAVQCKGQKILFKSVNAGEKLYFLAAGNDKNETPVTFLVNGQPTTLKIEYFTQFVGQLEGEFTNGLFKTDKIAQTFTHRHNGVTGKNESYQFNYLFSYSIPVPQGDVELTLPTNDNIVVFAATVALNPNDELTPVQSLMDIPKSGNDNSTVQHCGDELKIVTAVASAEVSSVENASKAIDGDSFTKWCDNSSSEKWLEINLDKPSTICEWSVLHAACESVGYITSAFRLQKFVNANWENVDVVTDNTSNNTTRVVTPFTSQRVRLFIDQAERDGNTAARIYEFKVYGNPVSTGIGQLENTTCASFGCYPNPVTHDEVTFKCNVSEENMTISIDILDLTGKMIAKNIYHNTESGSQEFKWNLHVDSGAYIYQMRMEKNNELKFISSNKMVVN